MANFNALAALRPQITPRVQTLSPQVVNTSTPPGYEGLTLDALMARQKELAAAQSGMGQMDMGTPMQGIAGLANSLVNNLQQSKARRDEQQAREVLAQLIGGMGAGGPTQQDIATASRIDPDFALRLQERGWGISDEARERQQELQDIQGQRTFSTGEREAGQGFTTSERLAKEASDARVRQQQIDEQIAAEKRAEEQAGRERAATPDTALGKLKADLDEGRITKEQYDAAIAKENAPSVPLVDMSTNDSSKLRQKFNEEVGTKMFPKYLQEGAVAGGLKQGMELLDALGTAPQGPLVGRLAQAFPGFDTNAAAFESIVKRLAPAQREPGSGSTSDIEYQGMLQSLPSLINDPNANKLISGMVKAQAQISMERADIVTRWQAGELNDGQAFKALNDLNGRSIMTPELQTMIDNATKGTQPVIEQASPDDDALIEKYLPK